jgi:hypothetical protein
MLRAQYYVRQEYKYSGHFKDSPNNSDRLLLLGVGTVVAPVVPQRVALCFSCGC